LSRISLAESEGSREIVLVSLRDVDQLVIQNLRPRMMKKHKAIITRGNIHHHPMSAQKVSYPAIGIASYIFL
jgi:hypothetical protein